MIKSDFYPTVNTPTEMNNRENTDTITNLNLTDKLVDPIRAYYMGKIPDDAAILYCCKFSVEGTGNNRVWKLEKIPGKKMWAYGYTTTTNTNFSSIMWNNVSGKWQSNIRMLNALSPYYCNFCDGWTVNGYFYDFSQEQILGTGEKIYISNNRYSASFQMALPGAAWFFFQQKTANRTITVNGNDYEINMSKWNEEGKYFDLGNGKRFYIYSIVLRNPGALDCRYYNNNGMKLLLIHSAETGRDSDSLFGSVCIFEFTQVTATDNRLTLVDDKYTEPIAYGGGVMQFTNDDPGVCYTKPFEISYAFANYATTSGIGKYCTNGNGDVLYSTGSPGYEQVAVNYCIDFLQWGNTVVKIIPCAVTNNDATGASVTPDENASIYTSYDFVSLFDSQNTPRQIITKKMSYAQLEPLLQPWQKYGGNINDNSYDPYSPGDPVRPDPTPFPDGENVGDDITLPETLGIGSTLGFITQYCMNATQIAALGQALWTSFTDPDYWKNFFFRFILDTGSLNMSDLLNFFISLRVYPFPLINIPSYSNFGQDMFIGTGAVPLHFTSDLHTINTLCEFLDAGSLQLPFIFGDFRDCANMEIILYLPYCGTVQLEPAEVLGGTLSAKYAIDFGSGACTAYVEIETWDAHKYMLAALPGQIGSDVPMSATVAGQIAARIGSDVLNVAGTIGGGVSDTSAGYASLIGGLATDNPVAALSGAGKIAASSAATAGGIAQQLAGMAMRPGISAPMLSGGRGFSAHGSPRKCYVQIRYPFYQKPDSYDSIAGSPAVKKVQVSTCSGLCRFVNPDVSGVAATEQEKNQIRTQLAHGIIV